MADQVQHPGSDVFPAATPAPASDLATRVVDAINGVFGAQRRNRAIHAKGIVVQGSFVPDRAGAELTRAPHLQAQPTPVTVRFSNFSGNPDVADTDPTASPRGGALKFHLPDGGQTDIVMHSFDGFPTRTTEELRQLLVALAQSGPGVARPTPAERFLQAHPIARAFLEAPKPPPVSYGTLRYFGVNSFRFTNRAGVSVFGRYRLEPMLGEQLLAASAVAAAPPDYLQDELRARLAAGPCRFALVLQLAAPGDVIDDPSQAWPDTRRTVGLGTLVLDGVVADNDAAEQALLYSPARVTEGIEPADAMLLQRSDAYLVSYRRRHS